VPTATERRHFAFDYTPVLDLIAFALSGLLLFVYRRGLGAPGRYRDPVCGMRVDEDGPSLTHGGETDYFCSKACRRAFRTSLDEYADAHATA